MLLSEMLKTLTTSNFVTQEENEKTIKESIDEIAGILESEILVGNSNDETKKEQLKKLRKFTSSETNIMLVGATGCGKSSTINALFHCSNSDEQTDSNEIVEIAKVGTKAVPETKEIEKYTIGNLILWDTPGLGDGTEIDQHHKEIIQDLIKEKDDEGNALIDLVLVILDGSTKDLGTSYKILNEVIIPEIGEETNRIIVALNQADIAMKTGRHWNYEKNEPDETLLQFLNEKVESIKNRIKEDSNIDVNPVYYCAGYQEESGDTVHPYNLSKLLYCIMNSVPLHKRVAVIENINTDSDNYEFNDSDLDYNEEVQNSFFSAFDYITEGMEDGAEFGKSILGLPGMIVGGIIGGAVGCIKGLFSKVFG